MSHLSTSSHAPSPAVEVVATLGDSIVGVRHVTDPRAGRTTTTTRAMIIGGALAIATGVIAFLAATRIASANHADLVAWVAAKKPAWAFRAELVPTWMSLLSLLGLTGGLTAMVSGLARRRRELEPSTISIGSDAGVDFAVGGTVVPNHALVAPQGSIFVVDLTGMTGEITDATGAHPITPMAAALPVTQGMTVRAKLGQVGFYIAAVEAPRRQTTPLAGMFDRRAASYVVASAAAHLALWAFARTIPAEPMDINAGLFSTEDPTTLVLASINDTTPPEPEQPTDDGVDGATSGANAMALEKGTVGTKQTDSADPAKRTIAQRNAANELARQEALAAAASAGILGNMQAADPFQSIVGVGPVSSGFDAVDMIGGFDGDGTGAPYGFGQNKSGFDVGGGGWSFRTGGYNTFGDGRDRGEGWGIRNNGRCQGVCKDREPRIPRLGKPTEVGPGYDKEIVRRYVKRKLAQISYCYDKQLLVNPELSGTVMAEWTITPNGGVSSATAKGVHPEVASCIAGVIATIEFPKPPQIGIFKVRYPFDLRKPGA